MRGKNPYGLRKKMEIKTKQYPTEAQALKKERDEQDCRNDRSVSQCFHNSIPKLAKIWLNSLQERLFLSRKFILPHPYFDPGVKQFPIGVWS